MALAPFFNRIYGAVGAHLAISRESLMTALESTVVGIQCTQNPNDNEMWIAELSTNLLARLYPRVSVSAPQTLSRELEILAKKINPNIEFVSKAPSATSICVGSVQLENAIYPSACGWIVHIDHNPSKQNKISLPNPYAAGAAAAMGCAELFRRIFTKNSPEQDYSVSLLDFGDGTGANQKLKAADIGDVLFVGSGAVGNAALWALSRDTKLKGRLTIIDPEDIAESNLQRYVLATYEDVGRSKVQLAKNAISRNRLAVKTNRLSLEDYANEHAPIATPVIVISVDNVEARRAAQALLPRIVINGWTSDQALGASWHLFSRDAACLSCLYHPHGQGSSAIDQASKALGLSHDRTASLWITHNPLTNEDIRTAAESLGVTESALASWSGKYIGELYTDVVCGAVPLDIKGIGKVEMVPLAHQSTLAGILMAVELLKRTQNDLAKISQPEPLISWDSILQSPPKFWRKPRAREIGCICGDKDYQEIYVQKWARSPKSKKRR